jgi:hypothetical protein
VVQVLWLLLILRYLHLSLAVANELIVPVAYVSTKSSSTISPSALVLVGLPWILSEPSGTTKQTPLLCLQIARSYA